MTSVHISKGQGLTQALKAYAQSNGYDVSGISKEDWTKTISQLETIQKSREENNNPNSIYEEIDSAKPYGNMLVHEGDIEFTGSEMKSLFTAMGLQTKADAYEQWTVDINKSTTNENDDNNMFQLKSDDSHDETAYNNDLAQLAEEYIWNYDTDGDGEISFDEFKAYELKQVEDNTAGINKQALDEATKTLETTFNHLNVETDETKDTLDKREIMNFFFSMDSLDSKSSDADGDVSAASYLAMGFALADDSEGKDSDGNKIFDFLKSNFNGFFKNFNK